MKMFIFYLSVFLGLTSCSKTSMDLFDSGMNEDLLIASQLTEIVQDPSGSEPEGVGCLKTFTKEKVNAFKSARELPVSYGGQYLVTVIGAAHNKFDNCMLASQSSSNPNGPEEVSYDPTETTEEPQPMDHLTLFQTVQAYDGGSLLPQILSAYRLSMEEEPYLYQIPLRVLSMYKKLPISLFGSEGYHGNYDDRANYILAVLEILAGESYISSGIYNQFVLSNSSEYLTYPASILNDTLRWIRIYDVNKEITEYNYPISIIYDAKNVVYHQNPENVMIHPDLEVDFETTDFYYNAGNGRLYSDSNFTSTIPNGYYWLPKEHPSAYERNNYIVHIVGGSIVATYR